MGLSAVSTGWMAWLALSASTFDLTTLPPALLPSSGFFTFLTLHLQLVDVDQPVATPPTQQPANKFKLVALMEHRWLSCSMCHTMVQIH